MKQHAVLSIYDASVVQTIKANQIKLFSGLIYIISFPT
jgi:hypothetical protein